MLRKVRSRPDTDTDDHNANDHDRVISGNDADVDGTGRSPSAGRSEPSGDELSSDAILVDAEPDGGDDDEWREPDGGDDGRDDEFGTGSEAIILPAAASETAATQDALSPVSEHEPLAALWQADEVVRFQERWRKVQLQFVDDPQATAKEAEALASEIVDRFSSALVARKAELDAWNRYGGDGGSTEQLLVAVRQYRSLLDQLLSIGEVGPNP